MELVAETGWEPTTAPPSGSPEGRFALNVNSSGNPSPSLAATVSNTYSKLGQALAESRPTVGQEYGEIAFKFVGRRTDNGEWTIFERGSVRRPITVAPCRPGKFTTSSKLEAGDAVDDLLLGGKTFETMRDDDVYKALKAQLAALNPSPREARAINDAVCIALALRAGLVIHPGSLPNVQDLADDEA
jgi:hypothetical protein